MYVCIYIHNRFINYFKNLEKFSEINPAQIVSSIQLLSSVRLFATPWTAA